MPTFEDAISDETVEEVEEAKTAAKRSKTKYGHLLESNSE